MRDSKQIEEIIHLKRELELREDILKQYRIIKENDNNKIGIQDELIKSQDRLINISYDRIERLSSI